MNVLSEGHFKHEDKRFRKLGIIDVISLKVIDGDVKIIEHEMRNSRVAI